MAATIRRYPRNLNRFVFLLLGFVFCGVGAPLDAQRPSEFTVLALRKPPDDAASATTNAIWYTTLRDVLKSRVHGSVDLFQEAVPFDRLATSDSSLALRDYLRTRYRARRPDLVIASTSSVREFVLQYRDELFPGIPLVIEAAWTSDLSNRDKNGGAAAVEISNVLLDPLRLALQLHPNTRQVCVLVGRTSPVMVANLRRAHQAIAGRVPVTFITELPVPEMLRTIEALPPDSLVFYINYVQEVPGRTLSEFQVARLVAEASPVPVYGFLEAHIGLGMVGGVVLTPRNEATQVGELAARILNGDRAANLPIEPVRLLPMFDWRQLRRWGLDEDVLPPGAEIRFRELTTWQRHRWVILGTVAVLGLQTAMIVGLVVQRARRREMAAALDKTQRELSRVARVTALGEFAASIAHEVRQPLTAVISSARAAARFLNSGATDEAQEALGYVLDASKQADRVIERNRELFRNHAVQKELLDWNSIVAESARMARSRLESSQVSLFTSIPPGLPRIEGDGIELRQVLLNLIVNAVDAMETLDPALRRLEISTAFAPPETLRISVTDNGVGLGNVDLRRLFTFSYTTKPGGTGVGLAISRSIIEAHGGKLWAEQNETGATFSFTLPAAGAPAEGAAIAS